LREFSHENQKSGLAFSRSVLERFGQYSWPGNIRELRTAVEHGVVMAKGQTIELSDLPSGIRDLPSAGRVVSVHTGEKLEELEHEAIRRALIQTNQNITEAAKQLGISRRTLHRKLAGSRRGGLKPK